MILSYFDAIIICENNYSLTDTYLWKGNIMANIELEKVSIKIESIAALLTSYGENLKGGIRGESNAMCFLAGQLYECADTLDAISQQKEER